MRFCFATCCLLFVAAVSHAQQPPAANAPLVAGDRHAVWLVLPSDDGKTFDVMIRPGSLKWRLLSRRLTGKPVMTAAMGGTLQVIFRDPLGHGAFSESSAEMMPLATPSAPSWPQGALPAAICAAPKLGSAAQASLLAMVHQYQPAPKWATTTRAASAPTVATTTSTSVATPKGPGVLQPYAWNAGQWRPLNGALALDDSFDHLLTTVAGDTIYCLLASRNGNRLAAGTVSDNGEDVRWQTIPLDKALASATPMSALPLANKLAIVAAAPAPGEKLRANLFILEDGSQFSSSSLGVNKVPFEWPSGSGPVAVQTGDQFELIWRQEGKMMAASCSLGGEMLAPVEVPISKVDADIHAQQLYMYFLTGVLVVVLVLLALGPMIRPVPFEVPAQMVPASLIKRGFAAVIDMAPWNLVAGLLVGVFPSPWDAATFSEHGMTQRVLYFQALSQSMYVLYCIVAEATVGVTMGKRLMGIRTITDGGAKPNLRSVALRNVVKIIELQGIPLLILPGQFPLMLLFPLLTAYRLRLGDMLARTAVVQAKPQE